MVIILLGTHLFLTVRLRFPQRKLFKAIRLSVQSDKSGLGDVSQFGALATALAATIGTGNIVGVATAITLGGPGAVFWCWLTGVLGISTKYAEGLLAVKYRIRTPQGKCWEAHVCLGTGNGHEMARRLVLHLHGVRLFRYRQSGAKQRHIHAVLRDIPCAAGTYRNGSSRMRGFGRHFRRERYRTCL